MSVNVSINLKKLRVSRAMSQKDVAEKANISVAAYRKLERGETQDPRHSTLANIAKALSSSIEALTSPSTQNVGVRFRSKNRIHSRHQIIESFLNWLKHRQFLEERLGIQPKRELFEFQKQHKGQLVRQPESKLSEIELSQIASKVREKLFGLKNNEPIQDIYGLLEERAGIKTHSFVLMNDEVFGVSVFGGGLGPAIAVNCWERISVERWIFTAAHELGHLILHPNTFDDVDEHQGEIEDEEHEANVFASHFLMPAELFDSEWEKTQGLSFLDRIFSMKRLFRVSYKTVLYRLYSKNTHNTGSFNVWRKFNSDHKERYGKTLTLKEEAGEPLPASAYDRSEPENKSAREEQREHALPEGFVDKRLISLALKAYWQKNIDEKEALEILGWDKERLQKAFRDLDEQVQLGLVTLDSEASR